ncbi:glycerophosphodiester phosphodiesterase family protein [Lentilactobacillus raoultii]|uniref:Glycerophosphodiester phosphodiesterase family protein n=1 Tax=Lentilactobacillus raoultii TaxID=1987503 RepID=A0ABW3PLF8_9LACO|nr:glycerophosphodiester phosphodiesterase family protein [Lentilactobacillus raoultii]
MTNETLIFGHRGYPYKFPENSLSGFAYAVEHGVDGLEFDVHLTKDNIPVIMHDEKINRTTNGRGKIRDYTYQQLQQFQLRNGETIPSLRDLLSLVSQKPVYLNLEFKTNKIHYPNIERIVLDMVKEYNLAHPVIYSSFSLQTLKDAYRVDPSQQYCLLSNHILKHPRDLMIEAHLAGLHLSHYQPLRNIKERIWTIDDPKKQRALLADHVAGIITDNFEMAKNVKSSVLV